MEDKSIHKFMNKGLMVCSGSEHVATGWKAQMNLWSYLIRYKIYFGAV